LKAIISIFGVSAVFKLNKSVTLALVGFPIVTYCDVASSPAPLKIVCNITLTEVEREVAHK